MANREVLDQIQRGYRMPRHENCPDKIYDYMLRCWDASPDNRPTFEVCSIPPHPHCHSLPLFFSIYIYSSMITPLLLVHNITARINIISFIFLPSQDMLLFPCASITPNDSRELNK